MSVEIEWFPAASGALPLGQQCCITIPFWEHEQFEYTDGELPLTTVVPTGRPVVKPGTGRGHVCGDSADFLEGGLYAPDDPPVVYGASGLPSCCGAPVVGTGGAIDGGRCGVGFPVVPGTGCATATEIPLGAWLEVETIAGQEWWLYTTRNTPAPGVRTVTAEGDASGVIGSRLTGTCAFNTFLDFWSVPSAVPFITGPLGEFLFIAGPPLTGGANRFRIRVD